MLTHLTRSPDVSIICVNWNSEDYLIECIRSIYDTTHDILFEIIVVDNASSKDDLQRTEAQFPDVKLIRSSENLGFAGANNLGFKHSTGSAILLLNPDTEILGNAIANDADGAAAISRCRNCRMRPSGPGSFYFDCIGPKIPHDLESAVDDRTSRSAISPLPLVGYRPHSGAGLRPREGGSNSRRLHDAKARSLRTGRDVERGLLHVRRGYRPELLCSTPRYEPVLR